jgi:hypothetical protein
MIKIQNLTCKSYILHGRHVLSIIGDKSFFNRKHRLDSFIVNDSENDFYHLTNKYSFVGNLRIRYESKIEYSNKKRVFDFSLKMKEKIIRKYK